MPFDWEYLKSVFLRPHLGLNQELQSPSVPKAFRNFFGAAIIGAVFYWIGVALGNIPKSFTTVFSWWFPSLEFPLSLLAFQVTAGIVGAIIGLAFVFGISRVLGGKGSFSSLFYGTSLLLVPYSLLGILVIIPFIGYWVSLIASSLASLYAIYFFAIVLKRSQSLSAGRTVAALFVYFLVVFIVVLLLVFTFVLGTLLQPGAPPVETMEGNFVRYQSGLHGGYSFLYPIEWKRIAMDSNGEGPSFMGNEFLDFVFFQTAEDKNSGLFLYVMPSFMAAGFSGEEIPCTKEYWQGEFSLRSMGENLKDLKDTTVEEAVSKKLGMGKYCIVSMREKTGKWFSMAIGSCSNEIPVMAMNLNENESEQTTQQRDALLESFSC